MDLSPYAVLEVGEYVGVPYAGKLLSGMGADVLKVEPPDGDPARRVGPFPAGSTDPDESAYFAALNTDKRAVTLDPESAPGPAIVRDLIETLDVDVVLEGSLPAYGVDPRALCDEYDDLSVVSLTGFGRTGPWQEYLAPEIVATAQSGQMNKMGYPDRPPTRLRIKAAEYMGGQFAAMAALAALHHRDVGGGPGQYVDVSKREAGTSSMEYFLTGYSWSGHTTRRTGNGYPHQGSVEGRQTIYETADGHISVGSITDDRRWEIFCTEFAERPELLDDERFETAERRRENDEAVLELLEEYTRTREKWPLFDEFQAHGIACAVTATVEDIVEFEHLHERDFWREVALPSGEPVSMPGFPFRPGGEAVEMGRPPRLGEHDAEVYAALGYDPGRLASVRSARGNSREDDGGFEFDDASGVDAAPSGRGGRLEPASDDQPLDGIRIVDFTWIGAGPQATKFLAGLGADVVKIESARKPDGLRKTRGFVFDETESLDVSAFFAEFNQDKRSINLDLTTERGRELALELIAEADVLAENFSPDFMERIGFDYERLREVNPELVYLSMPGWGKEGPAKSYRSYGNNLQSMAGLDELSGFPGDPPTTSGQSWPDPVAGQMGAVPVIAALLHRAHTGEGSYVELPQFEMAVSFLHEPLMRYLMHGELPERVGNRDEDGRYVQGAYPCAGEDRWAVVAVGSDGQWARLCRVIGRPDLVDDERFESQYARIEHHDAVDEVVADWTADRSPEEVRERLQDHDVPAGIVANERDLLDHDEQLRARDYVPEYEHPEVGVQRYGGIPFRMSDARVEFDRYPPLFGEHTEEVLVEWLGMDPEEIRRAQEEEILH